MKVYLLLFCLSNRFASLSPDGIESNPKFPTLSSTNFLLHGVVSKKQGLE